MRCASSLILLTAILQASCSSSAPPPEASPAGPPWLEDITESSGVDFTLEVGPLGSYLMQQTVGSGCAATDLDGDGRPDLLFLTNAGPGSSARNKLYRQREDGTFEDVSAGSGLDFPGHNMGIAVGDIDDDGRPDILITQYVGARLFRNLGNMKFRDITTEAGVKNPLWGVSACFFDYDRDGRLDIAIANYLEYDPSWACTSPGGDRDYCAPTTFAGTTSKLFRNLGPGPGGVPRFEDVSFASGIGRISGPGLGVVPLDFTGDGWTDLFITNDGKPNHLWVNQGNGIFKEEAVSRGVAYTMAGQAFAGMGIGAGDVDNDGLFDLFVTHLTSETNTFWKQGPRGSFRDETAAWEAARTDWRGTGFGVALVDLNLDGNLDVAIVNGRVSKAAPRPVAGLDPFWHPYCERNQILSGDGRRFHDVSVHSPAFTERPNVGRGLAVADLNGDGAPDVITTAVGGKARILRNVCPKQGHWFAVRCRESNRDARGAEVTVRAGGRQFMRLANPAASYLTSGTPHAHFGLGSAAAIDSIEVRWPDGSRESFPPSPVDRLIDVRKGTGTKL